MSSMNKNVVIYVEKTKQKLIKYLSQDMTFDSLLKELKINKETVIIAKDGKVVLESDNIGNAKKIEIISVISGG